MKQKEYLGKLLKNCKMTADQGLKVIANKAFELKKEAGMFGVRAGLAVAHMGSKQKHFWLNYQNIVHGTPDDDSLVVKHLREDEIQYLREDEKDEKDEKEKKDVIVKKHNWGGYQFKGKVTVFPASQNKYTYEVRINKKEKNYDDQKKIDFMDFISDIFFLINIPKDVNHQVTNKDLKGGKPEDESDGLIPDISEAKLFSGLMTDWLSEFNLIQFFKSFLGMIFQLMGYCLKSTFDFIASVPTKID